MDFTIVTPSFRQLEHLSCCIASIADQPGVAVEHIVQDGGTEGFEDFAKKMAEKWPDRPGYRRIMVSESDQGMYDALNRGFKKATGSFCAYLNCDEQYLPGTLERVVAARRFKPEIDIFFGDVIVLSGQGQALCWRKVLVPLTSHTWTCHFAAFTAAMFFRQSLFQCGLVFDISYRAAADAAWYLEVRRNGAQAARLDFVTAAFFETGANLGLSEKAWEERKRLTNTAPGWMKRGRWLWMVIHRFRRWAQGSLKPRNLKYEVYLPGEAKRRKFSADNVPGHWPGRWRGF